MAGAEGSQAVRGLEFYTAPTEPVFRLISIGEALQQRLLKPGAKILMRLGAYQAATVVIQHVGFFQIDAESGDPVIACCLTYRNPQADGTTTKPFAYWRALPTEMIRIPQPRQLKQKAGLSPTEMESAIDIVTQTPKRTS